MDQRRTNARTDVDASLESVFESAGDHLAPQLVQRFVHGALSPDSMRVIHSHADHCERCFSAIAGAAQELSVSSSAAPQIAAPLVGSSRVGPYLITGLLGRGGMGVVYRARHESGAREVALKMLRGQTAAMRARMRLEIEVLKQTRHPGVVQILEADVRARDPWYAMELLEGETLEGRLWNVWSPALRCAASSSTSASGVQATLEDAALPESRLAGAGRLHELLSCIAQLCEPLGFVHAAGIVHGDLKPANVYLRNGTEPVLVDFGLVSPAAGAIGRERLHVAGRVVGTAAYLAPEVIAGKVVDARADLYSLGCLLYEAVTGRPPFWGLSTDAILKQHREAAVVPPSARVSGVPAELDALIALLLEKDPARRLGHAFDVATALHALVPSFDRARTQRAAPLLYRPRMVGRSRELGKHAAYLREVASGRTVFSLVSGESGIGKSFLTTEVCRAAVLEGFQVVTGECLPLCAAAGGAGGAPLQAFRCFLELVADTCRERDHEELAQSYTPLLQLLAAYEPSLQSLVDAEAPPELPAFAARERVIRAVLDLISAWCEREPLLIALDDLQWADDLSLAVLELLSEPGVSQPKLLLLGTYRSEEAGDGIQRIAHKPNVRLTKLNRLTRDQVSEMVSGLLALTEPPRSVVGFVHHHSEGIPFFVAEYVRALAAEGLLHRVSGRWLLGVGEHDSQAAFAAISFPTELAQLVKRRLSGLPGELIEVLEIAAVLGRTFEVEILARAAELPDASVRASLRELEARHVVANLSAERYAFLHDKLRESVYSGLSGARRRQLHRAAALAIEAEQTGEPSALLAHHYCEAGDLASSIDCFEAAAQRALQLSAAADALRALRELSALVELSGLQHSALRRARWERMTADAYQGLGLVSESEAPLERAAALLGCPMPKREWQIGARLLPEIARQIVHRLRSKPSFEPREREREIERGRVFDRLQRVYYFHGNDSALLLATASSLNVLQMPTPELAVAFGFGAAVMDIFVRSRSLAELYFELGRDTLRHIQDASAESNLHMLFALYHLGHGRFEAGIPWADEAIRVARSSGFFRRLAESLAVRAGLELLRGRHLPAQPFLNEMCELTIKRDDAQMLAWATFQRTHALCLAGALDEAACALQSIEARAATLSRPDRIWLHSLSCYVAYRRDDIDSAALHQASALNLVELGPPCHSGCLDAYGKLAEIAVALEVHGRMRDAARACAMLAAAARSFPLLEPVLRLHNATRARFAGKRGQAERQLREGLLSARRLGMSFEQARIRVALAQSMGEGPER
ncbi:MAG TPA: protein kinase, partial [Polyangiales bacterium]|nr:protein kinase [Polyangiales bacterium]